MFLEYIIEWWEDGKAHILHLYSIDDCLSDVDIDDDQIITIGADRLYINENLTDKDYADFFEVTYENGNPSKIAFKRGRAKSVKVKTGFESVGKRGFHLTVTKVIGCKMVTA